MQFGAFRRERAAATTLENFGRVAKILVDPKTNEAYVADGYGNKRVAVLDADTGKIKRYWGAYGNKPDDTEPRPLQSRRAAGAAVPQPGALRRASNDGLVYVCDRPNDRIQVFTQDGKFVKEAFVAKNTLGDGSVWDIAFSKDPQQKFIFLADGANEQVRIFDARDAGGAHQLRRRRPPARPVLRRAQHRRPTRRATSTRPRPTRASACRSSSTRASGRCRAAIRACSGRENSAASRPNRCGALLLYPIV